MIAARLVTGDGKPGPKKIAPMGAISGTEAAKKLRVSAQSVRRAQAIQNGGIPELQRAVDDGTISVRTGAIVATMNKKKQRQTMKQKPEVIKKVAKDYEVAVAKADKGFNGRPANLC